MIAKEYLTNLGVYKLFENSRYNKSDSDESFRMMSALILMPEFLVPISYEALQNESNRYTDSFLTSVYKHIGKLNLNLSDHSLWLKLSNDISDTLDDADPNSILNGYMDYAIDAASHVEGFDWKPLFERLYYFQKTRNYTYASFRNIMKTYADTASESFKDFAEKEVFFSKQKPSYTTRGVVYSQYISSGLLCKKTARKMRSDGSSDASLDGLKSLFKNSEKYSNFDELVLQFSDTKYDEVVCYLAENLPEYLLTSIMGTDSYWGKRTLEKRFRAIEMEREGNE